VSNGIIKYLIFSITYQAIARSTDEFRIKQHGGKIIREAGPMNAGSTIIAFVEDPDGYQIELLAKRQ